MTAQAIPNPIPPIMGPGNPTYDRWKNEVDFFEQERERLCADAALRSKYVAIYRHAIVDVHEDPFELGRRMSQLHPKEVVLIVKVEPADPRVELPSLEVRH